MSVPGETPKFVDLRLSAVNIADKLNSVFAPVTRAEGLADRPEWLTSRHIIAEVTEGRVSKVQAYSDYIKNSEFETRNIFEQENIQMTQPDQNIPLTRLNENIPMTRLNENIPMTLLNENIPLTLLIENIPMTRLNENIPMTQLNKNIPMTRLNENSPLTRRTEFSETEKRERTR